MMQMNEGKSKLLLIGDSIMLGWEYHKELCEMYFGDYQPLNLGFDGDQTQNVLWHLDHLPLNRIQPKVALVLIGTNNVGFSNGMSADETSEGIKRIAEKLQTSFPAMQILVLKVFPRDYYPESFLRKRIDVLNERLTETLNGMSNVHLVDINSGLLDEKGALRRELFADHIHLNEAGYDYWGKTIVPIIKEKFE
jgi:beta-glucosidase